MNISYDMITCYAVRAAGPSHEFLQLRRVPNDYMGGTWQAVSGGIEPGETAMRAALRELQEEAGLAPLEFYRLPVINSFYISDTDTVFHSVPFCAIVDPAAQVTLNPEHDASRWVPRNAVDQAFMWATDRQAIAELCREVLDGNAAKAYLRVWI